MASKQPENHHEYMQHIMRGTLTNIKLSAKKECMSNFGFNDAPEELYNNNHPFTFNLQPEPDNLDNLNSQYVEKYVLSQESVSGREEFNFEPPQQNSPLDPMSKKDDSPYQFNGFEKNSTGVDANLIEALNYSWTNDEFWSWSQKEHNRLFPVEMPTECNVPTANSGVSFADKSSSITNESNQMKSHVRTSGERVSMPTERHQDTENDQIDREMQTNFSGKKQAFLVNEPKGQALPPKKNRLFRVPPEDLHKAGKNGHLNQDEATRPSAGTLSSDSGNTRLLNKLQMQLMELKQKSVSQEPQNGSTISDCGKTSAAVGNDETKEPESTVLKSSRGRSEKSIPTEKLIGIGEIRSSASKEKTCFLPNEDTLDEIQVLENSSFIATVNEVKNEELSSNCGDDSHLFVYISDDDSNSSTLHSKESTVLKSSRGRSEKSIPNEKLIGNGEIRSSVSKEKTCFLPNEDASDEIQVVKNPSLIATVNEVKDEELSSNCGNNSHLLIYISDDDSNSSTLPSKETAVLKSSRGRSKKSIHTEKLIGNGEIRSSASKEKTCFLPNEDTSDEIQVVKNPSFIATVNEVRDEELSSNCGNDSHLLIYISDDDSNSSTFPSKESTVLKSSRGRSEKSIPTEKLIGSGEIRSSASKEKTCFLPNEDTLDEIQVLENSSFIATVNEVKNEELSSNCGDDSHLFVYISDDDSNSSTLHSKEKKDNETSFSFDCNRGDDLIIDVSNKNSKSLPAPIEGRGHSLLTEKVVPVEKVSNFDVIGSNSKMSMVSKDKAGYLQKEFASKKSDSLSPVANQTQITHKTSILNEKKDDESRVSLDSNSGGSLIIDTSDENSNSTILPAPVENTGPSLLSEDVMPVEKINSCDVIAVDSEVPMTSKDKVCYITEECVTKEKSVVSSSVVANPTEMTHRTSILKEQIYDETIFSFECNSGNNLRQMINNGLDENPKTCALSPKVRESRADAPELISHVKENLDSRSFDSEVPVATKNQTSLVPNEDISLTTASNQSNIGRQASICNKIIDENLFDSNSDGSGNSLKETINDIVENTFVWRTLPAIAPLTEANENVATNNANVIGSTVKEAAGNVGDGKVVNNRAVRTVIEGSTTKNDKRVNNRPHNGQKKEGKSNKKSFESANGSVMPTKKLSTGTVHLKKIFSSESNYDIIDSECVFNENVSQSSTAHLDPVHDEAPIVEAQPERTEMPLTAIDNQPKRRLGYWGKKVLELEANQKNMKYVNSTIYNFEEEGGGVTSGRNLGRPKKRTPKKRSLQPLWMTEAKPKRSKRTKSSVDATIEHDCLGRTEIAAGNQAPLRVYSALTITKNVGNKQNVRSSKTMDRIRELTAAATSHQRIVQKCLAEIKALSNNPAN